jgi:addiction module HigA family antidote
MARPVNRLRPVHPGEVLREDYLVPLGLSVNALSIALGVPATRIHEIVKERRAVTADTAARLAKHFGGDAASWLVLQANYDLKTLPTAGDIERTVPVRRHAVEQHA